MTGEQELIAEYKTEMNMPHSEWHDADKELPPLENEEYLSCKVSINVLVSDGERIHISRYDYDMDGLKIGSLLRDEDFSKLKITVEGKRIIKRNI